MTTDGLIKDPEPFHHVLLSYIGMSSAQFIQSKQNTLSNSKGSSEEVWMEMLTSVPKVTGDRFKILTTTMLSTLAQQVNGRKRSPTCSKVLPLT